MRWPIRISLLIATALSLYSLAFAQTSGYDLRPRTASVSGHVTVAGKPLANATVTLTEDVADRYKTKVVSVGGREFTDPHVYKAETDSEGRYQINWLPAGTFRISPEALAYVPESNALGGDPVITITLDEGEARENVDFALVRGGVITGRVMDEDGRPQVARKIWLTEVVSKNERREATRILPVTDDRGVYRAFGIRAGRYIVRAGGEQDWLMIGVRAKITQLTYHPDALRAEEAKVIEVAEGSEVTGVDIRLRNPEEGFTVSGQVIDSETGKPVAKILITCFAVEQQENEWGNSVADPITDDDGNFTALGVKPGKYKVRLQSPYNQDSEYYSESKYFEVRDADVSGIEVLARRGATVSGVMVVEEGGDAETQSKLSQAQLYAYVYQKSLQGGGWLVGELRSKVGADGGFRLVGVPPGEAQFRIYSDSTTPFHLLRIERDGVATGDKLGIGPGERINNVRVVVGLGGGVIRGLLKIVGGVLPNGVSLSVDALKEGSYPISAAGVVDEKGRFVIKGLLTGEYSLGISWSTKYQRPIGQKLVLPRLPKQRVSVTNGAETPVTITYDLSGKGQEQ
jgi:protocatechuate 3,4-dioxygenase beta subunit